MCDNILNQQYIKRLGPLEWILNTPSHHRVHHGRNPYCIDKNYAGTLIIWDRLFGTASILDLWTAPTFCPGLHDLRIACLNTYYNMKAISLQYNITDQLSD